MNQIETLDCKEENKYVKYLFLTNNSFSEIPPEMVNLIGLKHIAFNKNKIVDIEIEIFRDYKNKEVQITLSDNPIKIKPSQSYLTKEKLDLTKIPFDNANVDQNQEIMNQDEKIKEKLKKNKTRKVEKNNIIKIDTHKEEDRNKRKEYRYIEFHYKQVTTFFETQINDMIEEECLRNHKEFEMNQDLIRENFGRELREKVLKKYLIKELIEKKNEGVIRKFTDLDLKYDIKEAYEKYKKELMTTDLKTNEYSNNDKKTIEMIINDHKVDIDYRKKYLRKVADNSNNLVFLKSLSINIKGKKT